MIWYCEAPKMGGGWMPVLYHQASKPGPRQAGRDHTFRAGTPVEVPVWMWALEPRCSFAEIQMCLSPDGEFYGMPDEVHRAIVAYRRTGDPNG